MDPRAISPAYAPVYTPQLKPEPTHLPFINSEAVLNTVSNLSQAIPKNWVATLENKIKKTFHLHKQTKSEEIKLQAVSAPVHTSSDYKEKSLQYDLTPEESCMDLIKFLNNFAPERTSIFKRTYSILQESQNQDPLSTQNDFLELKKNLQIEITENLPQILAQLDKHIGTLESYEQMKLFNKITRVGDEIRLLGKFYTHGGMLNNPLAILIFNETFDPAIRNNKHPLNTLEHVIEINKKNEELFDECSERLKFALTKENCSKLLDLMGSQFLQSKKDLKAIETIEQLEPFYAQVVKQFNQLALEKINAYFDKFNLRNREGALPFPAWEVCLFGSSEFVKIAKALSEAFCNEPYHLEKLLLFKDFLKQQIKDYGFPAISADDAISFTLITLAVSNNGNFIREAALLELKSATCQLTSDHPSHDYSLYEIIENINEDSCCYDHLVNGLTALFYLPSPDKLLWFAYKEQMQSMRDALDSIGMTSQDIINLRKAVEADTHHAESLQNESEALEELYKGYQKLVEAITNAYTNVSPVQPPPQLADPEFTSAAHRWGKSFCEAKNSIERIDGLITVVDVWLPKAEYNLEMILKALILANVKETPRLACEIITTDKESLKWKLAPGNPSAELAEKRQDMFQKLKKALFALLGGIRKE